MIPEHVGRYRVLSELGRGAMGVVYRAHDDQLDREVAVKVLLGFAAEDRARFEREVRALSAAAHSNVVRLLDAGTDQGRPFLVQELLSGGTLAEKLRRSGRLPCAEAALITLKLSRGLAAAHSVGVLHRDLKPENVLLNGEGEPQLADFGLARRLAASESLTATGAVMGTPAYMAPEQAMGDLDRVGARSDVYGMGAILYELLTGQPPFSGKSVIDTLRAVVSDPLRPPSELRKDVSPELEAVCLCALEREPEARYLDADSLVSALEQVLATDKGGSPARLVASIAFGALALALAAGGLTGALLQERDESHARSSPRESPGDPSPALGSQRQAELPADEAETRSQADLTRFRQEAARLVEAGEAQKAEAVLRRALELAPRDLDARFLLATAHLSQGLGARAEAALKRILEEDPSHWGSLGALAERYLNTQRNAEALAITERMLGDKPDHPAAHFRRARALVGLKRPEPALAAINRALAKERNPRFLKTRAGIYWLLDQHTKALADLRSPEFEPFAPDVLCRQAFHLSQLDRFEESLEVLAACLEQAPSFPEALRLSLSLQIKANRLLPALRLADRLLLDFPKDASVHEARAGALLRLKRYEEAAAAARRSLELVPDQVGALDSLGLALIGLKRLSEALAPLRALLRLQPQRPEVLVRLALALHPLKGPEAALPHLNRALELNPDNVRALRLRSTCLARLGRAAEGVADLDRARLLRGGVLDAERDAILYRYQHKVDTQTGIRRTRERLAKSIDAEWSRFVLASFLVREPAPEAHAEGRALLEAIRKEGSTYAKNAEDLLTRYPSRD